MIILGFETTDAIASVALYLNGTVYCKELSEKLRHAESVLPAAERMLSEHDLNTSDIDAYAVDIGPGSFTGVRIGVCLANALAFANRKKVIPVNALEALSHPYKENNIYIASIIDAKNGNGYAALYYSDKVLIDPQACEISTFLKNIPSHAIMTGTACTDCADPSAKDVVEIAATRIGFDYVSPLYLKLSQAERMMK